MAEVAVEVYAVSEPKHLIGKLHLYDLSTGELALLTAMCLHNWDGTLVNASVERLAAYCKMSGRNVQILIKKLRAKHILTELAPANAHGKLSPAYYRINEYAMKPDPRMALYLTNQLTLPGVRQPQSHREPKQTTGEAISPLQMAESPETAQPVRPFRTTGETISQTGEIVSRTDETISPELDLDLEATGKATKKQHASGALKDWFAIKAKLQNQLSDKEYKLWVRPMYFDRVMGGNTLLLNLPYNINIVEAARAHRNVILEAAQQLGLPYLGVAFTGYREADKRPKR